MEIIYFVDGKVTWAIQAFYRFLYRKLKWSLEIQRTILYFVPLGIGMVVSIFQSGFGATLERTLDHSDLIPGIVDGVLDIVVWQVGTVWLASWLKKLHRLADPKRADTPDKLYEDGHKAWADVILTGLYIFLGVALLIDSKSADSIIYIGTIMMGFTGYKDFVDRKKTEAKKNPGALTAAMRKLLERVKNLGYKPPRPVYIPQ